MVIVNFILLKNRNFVLARTNSVNHRNVILRLLFFCRSIDKFSRTYYFGRIFTVTEVFESYRLLQTVMFLTDSVFRVLFAYFDESMGSIGGYELWRSWNIVDITPI